MGKEEEVGSNRGHRDQVRKQGAISDDSDEEYQVEEDETDDQSDDLVSLVGEASEDGSGNFVDEEEEEEEDEDVVVSVRRVPKSNAKRGSRPRENGMKRPAKRNQVVYDDEDEENGFSSFEDDEQEDVVPMRRVPKLKAQRGSRPRENGMIRSAKQTGIIYDDDEHELDEEEEDAVTVRSVPKSKAQKGSRPRKNGMRRSAKRTRVAYDNDEDEDDDDYQEDEADGFNSFEEDEEEHDIVTVRSVPKSKAQKESGPRKNGTRRSANRYRIAHDEDGDDDYKEGEDVDEEDWDEDYDEDDEEFTPDELDFVEEEEELSSSKSKLKKNSWHTVKKKGSSESQRRKRCAKTARTPSKNKRNVQTRTKEIRGTKSNRNPVLKRKRTRSCSDSDFVSSDSSDFDFTISEEEREQVREANEFCRRVNMSLRNSKRVLENAACGKPRIHSERKGKEKVEDIKSDVGKQVCGICLTEEGKNTVRGTLNCCSHFFCFACIMEWSKVESRCPLCKQRFSTISKPVRTSTRLDLRNLVIHIPERDQVYQPSEEELRNYLDPYENMICTECHEGGDDALMLLCDLCDSPAHTYCVGLGHEVPDGNWYCDGCRPSVGTTHSQSQDHTPAQRAGTASVMEEPSSVYENMAEIDLNVTIPETPMTPVNGFLPSPRYQGANLFQPSVPLSGVGVSTLSGRRRVHRFLLSNNRLNHIAGIADRSSTSSARAIPLCSQDDRANQLARAIPLCSQDDRANQLCTVENRISNVGASGHSLYAERMGNQCVSTQNRENFSGRPSLIRGQVQVPASADGMINGFLQWGRRASGFHSGLSGISGRDHLQECSGRLNWGMESATTSLPPVQNGDIDHQVV